MKLFKILIAATAVMSLTTLSLSAQESEEDILKFNERSYMKEAPVRERVRAGQKSFILTRPKMKHRKNRMLEPLSAEAKMRFMQTMMSTMPFSLQDMLNMMVSKKKALPGLSFDEVIESLQSKALDLNMRPTGHNAPWKVLRQIHDPNSPRVEFLSFCDLITMRLILDFALEMSAFLPCRISVAEDADGQIWLSTLDFDIRWLDTSPNQNRISDDLRMRAMRVRENIEKIMEAAATGDF